MSKSDKKRIFPKEVSRKQASELDLEAPRVAFLLDGDKSGKEKRKVLISAGFLSNDIVELNSKHVLEDYLDLDIYHLAINEELRRSFGNKHQIENKSQKTSTKIQINYNIQKFNDQNSFGHLIIDI